MKNNMAKKGNPQIILKNFLGLAAKSGDDRTVANTHTFFFGLIYEAIGFMILLMLLVDLQTLLL